MLADQPVRQARREGTYLLRTNLAAESAAELWTKYIQLTELDLNFECSVNPAIA